jgi:hypothetical protein
MVGWILCALAQSQPIRQVEPTRKPQAVEVWRGCAFNLVHEVEEEASANAHPPGRCQPGSTLARAPERASRAVAGKALVLTVEPDRSVPFGGRRVRRNS